MKKKQKFKKVYVQIGSDMGRPIYHIMFIPR